MRCRSASDLSARNSASFRNSNVAQNIFLGQTAGLGIIPREQHRAAAVEILQTLAPHLRVDTHVSKLGMADRQLVEISRTLARGGRIIAFDEPTSSLTPQERDGLFQVIRRDAGEAIIYISHRWKSFAQSPTGLLSCGTGASSRPTLWRNIWTRSSTS
jgi:ABC-type sugar transport system ATPase subunit